jgi:hypothetical protein
MPASVLLYGIDPALVRTRRLILERSGYQVLVSQNFEGTKQILDSQSVDLVVWCSSLPISRLEGEIRAAKHLRPASRHLILANGPSVLLDAPSDRLLETMEGPMKFLATVHQMISGN